MEKKQEDDVMFNITIPKLLLGPQAILLGIIIGGILVNQLLLSRLTSTTASTAVPTPAKLTTFDLSLDESIRNSFEALGSGHTHADMKVYINGQVLDFSKQEYFMKSGFLHVDYNQNKDDSSSVLHMHAKKVPMWVFFESLGMKLAKDSLALANGQTLRNENGNSLKFYVNGKKVDDLSEYIFKPLDKLLISYGSENDPNIEQQISSVTNFAKGYEQL